MYLCVENVTDLNSGIIICMTSLPHTGARSATRSVVPYRDSIEQFWIIMMIMMLTEKASLVTLTGSGAKNLKDGASFLFSWYLHLLILLD